MNYALRNLLYARRRAQNEQVVYHGTSADRAASIQAVGLVPYVGDNTKDKEGHDVEAHVCLTTDKKVAKKYAGSEGTVFAVELDSPHLSGVKPEPDEFEKSSVKVNTRIPPAALTVAERFKKAVVAFNSTKA